MNRGAFLCIDFGVLGADYIAAIKHSCVELLYFYIQYSAIVFEPFNFTTMSVMILNKEWHLAHPMPKKAALDQRIAWHLEHAKNCSCRGIPAKLQEEVKQQNKC